MKILYADDSNDDSLVKLLIVYGHEAKHVLSPEAAMGLGVDEFDVVISDWDFGIRSRLNGGQFFTMYHPLHPNTRFIIFSGLDRKVPEGAEFFDKANLLGLLESLK